MPRKDDPKPSKAKAPKNNPRVNGPVNPADNADGEDSDVIMEEDGDDGPHQGQRAPAGAPAVLGGETEEELRQRRKIRNAYRDIGSDLHEHQHDYEKPESTGLHETLKQVEEIFTEVQHTREAALDSNILYRIAESGKRQAQALHTDLRQFDQEEFAERTMRFLEQYQEGGENMHHVSQEAWEKLGDAVQPFFQRSPPLHFMFGSFERGPPERKVRKKTVKDPKDKEAEKANAPNIITNKQRSKTESTTEEVERVLSLLNYYYRQWGKNPICFFEFVINPQSFGQTVENIFHVSFLVKDGLARLFLDDLKLPVIEPVEKKEGQGAGDTTRHQVIMTLSVKEWQEMIKNFGIKKPIIPTRDHVDTADDALDQTNRSDSSDDSNAENHDTSQPSTSKGSSRGKTSGRKRK